jgi:hypothetical protein
LLVTNLHTPCGSKLRGVSCRTNWKPHYSLRVADRADHGQCPRERQHQHPARLLIRPSALPVLGRSNTCFERDRGRVSGGSSGSTPDRHSGSQACGDKQGPHLIGPAITHVVRSRRAIVKN